MTHFLAIGAPQIILILIVLIPLLLLPIVALIDILRNEFTANNKIVWIIVVIFFNFLGAFLYFIMSSKHKMRVNYDKDSPNKNV
ncbi:phospholipase D-like protein [Salegentibacter sp. 24]|jgi:uncharacterized membrane-anchored protein|uniref:PLD nuclease N-terminal domain-containing protein n=1 Tax=Salegentibacter sp. 24 TaxID=2183986 RepID=UPI00105DC144|nr:PLD nuclease N-terminal domain-containing protein [Salegentibacter sp. 24]TDN87245.1 phospholipase D-like protein [Salegentibacter sp. 24]